MNISELYDHRINKWLAIEDEWERKKLKRMILWVTDMNKHVYFQMICFFHANSVVYIVRCLT